MLFSHFLSLTFFYCLCESHNILVVFTHFGKSHFALYEHLFTTLASKRHNLTVISYYPRKVLISNYRDVILRKEEKSSEFFSFEHLNIPLANLYWLKNIIFATTHFENSCKMGYESEHFRRFLKEDNQFDVILMQYFISDCFMGLLKDLNAPFIGKFFISCYIRPNNL